jgi:hypothetical protein
MLIDFGKRLSEVGGTGNDNSKLVGGKKLAKLLFGKSLKYDSLGNIGVTQKEVFEKGELIEILLLNGFLFKGNVDETLKYLENHSIIYQDSKISKNGFNTSKVEDVYGKECYLIETFCD